MKNVLVPLVSHTSSAHGHAAAASSSSSEHGQETERKAGSHGKSLLHKWRKCSRSPLWIIIEEHSSKLSPSEVDP